METNIDEAALDRAVRADPELRPWINELGKVPLWVIKWRRPAIVAEYHRQRSAACSG